MTETRPGVPRRGRPARIDSDRIVATAAAMDPATLTMAAVARELGVSPGALYRWVPDREALLDLVSTRAARLLTPAWTPTPETWRDWLTEWAHNARRELGSVPGYAMRVLTGPHRAAGHAELDAAALAAFAAAGSGPERARQQWYAFSAAVVGWVAVEQAGTHLDGEPRDFDVLLEILVRGLEPG